MSHSPRNSLLAIAVVIAAAIAYAQLGTKSSASKSKQSEVRTAVITTGEVEQTIRLSGTIGAERFSGLMAPQLAGLRSGGGGGSSSGGSGSASTSSASSSSSSSASSSTSSGSGKASQSTNNSAAPSSASGPSSSLGALRGTTNRFGDRSQASASASSKSSGKASSASSGGSSPTSGLGSTAGSLINGSQRGGGGGGDFALVLTKLARAGAHVRKGEVVAEFDRINQLNRLDDYKASVFQLDANVKKLKADLAVAREAHDQLIRSAKADLDKAELDLKTAPVRSAIESETLKLGVEEAKAKYQQVLGEAKMFDQSQRAQIRVAEIQRDQSKIELDRATANVDRMVLRAPMDGVAVMQSIFRGGDFGQVQEGDQLWPGMTFMQVVDPSSMDVNAVVNQVDAESIRLGMKATVRLDAYPGLELPAHVIGIGAMTKPGVWRPAYMREIPVRLRLEKMDERVIPDVSASAEIHIAAEKQVHVVPLSAVFHEGPHGRPFVLIRETGEWARREVEPGLRNNTSIAVRSGVNAGDVVAIEMPPSEK